MRQTLKDLVSPITQIQEEPAKHWWEIRMSAVRRVIVTLRSLGRSHMVPDMLKCTRKAQQM